MGEEMDIKKMKGGSETEMGQEGSFCSDELS